jgi:small subunit ribosomal protein S3
LKENYFIKSKLKKIALYKYLSKKLKSAGFIDCEVVKRPLSTRVVIYSLKPGFVIGKKGSNIRALTADLEKDFGLQKVNIEIAEIQDKSLDAKVIIEEISNEISRGVSWKRVVYKALKKIKDAGAVGAEIVAKGNTAGKGQRKRKSRYSFGYLKKAGDQKDLVSFEKKTTFPGLGTIGIRLKIVKPGTVFSDKIDVYQIAQNYKIKIEEQNLEKQKEEADRELENNLKKKDSKEENTESKSIKKIKKTAKTDKVVDQEVVIKKNKL